MMQAQTAFYDIVDKVRELSMEEKIEIKDIIEKALIEERRKVIRRECQAGEKEYRKGHIKFTNDTDKLMEMLNK